MEEYIVSALSGDKIAFSKLYDNFSPAALRLSTVITRNPDLAEDAVQEAFIRVYKKGYQCKTSEKFEPWFFRIVINESKRILRKYPGEVELELSYMVSSFTEQADLSIAVDLALRELSLEHRTVLVLKFLLDYSEKEIGKIINKPVGTVKSRIYYAKKALADKMSGKEENEYDRV